MKDVVLEDLSVTGWDSVGGIAGYSSGSVSGCYVKGSVRGMKVNVGGIVGLTSGGKIEGCCFDGSVQGTEYVGGITGWADGASVKACRVKGVINGTDTVGGIASGLVAQIKDSSAECIGCCAGAVFFMRYFRLWRPSLLPCVTKYTLPMVTKDCYTK